MAGCYFRFLVTAVLLPLLSVLAISVTHAQGVYDIGLPLGSTFALVFMILIHLTIGPLFGTPRTASISFKVGIEPMLPQSMAQIGLLIFSTIFFVCAFVIAYKESNILTSIGKVLNPLFLLLLFIVFLMGFFSPMGRAADQKVTLAYQQAPFLTGFCKGIIRWMRWLDWHSG
ncbi:branched-chain amino acid transport system II carrier protein [Lactobacillus sp. R2/2]|nr:branched-chain amino acid transport system II carrier protein [Lactobacillus sp. R2/2]